MLTSVPVPPSTFLTHEPPSPPMSNRVTMKATLHFTLKTATTLICTRSTSLAGDNYPGPRAILLRSFRKTDDGLIATNFNKIGNTLRN
jgi:hypothetical protein